MTPVSVTVSAWVDGVQTEISTSRASTLLRVSLPAMCPNDFSRQAQGGAKEQRETEDKGEWGEGNGTVVVEEQEERDDRHSDLLYTTCTS